MAVVTESAREQEQAVVQPAEPAAADPEHSLLASTVLRLQATAGNAAVARMVAQRPARPTLSRLIAGALDFTTLAQRIHTAMAGLGTDEEEVYAALQQCERDPTAIASLKSAYLAQFGEDLEAAIRDDFSGSELEYALQLLGGGTPGSAQAIGGTPASAADFDASAGRIRTAVEGAGTDEEAIFAVLRPLNRDPALVNQLATAYNALYSEDMVDRLVDEMSGEELTYCLYLLRRGPSAGMERVTGGMEGEVGQQATWTGSGPGSGNTFEAWASAPSESAAPPISSSTSINCWEMILLCAYRAGMLSWQWIHDQYTAAVADWGAHMVSVLSRGARVPWTAGTAPIRGELVFMDGMAHVALATGNLDGAGRSEILSFWPPPNTPFTRGGTLDSVKVTTIEELRDFWAARRPPGFATIELAAPPWA
jgi:hypothetical protein